MAGNRRRRDGGLIHGILAVGALLMSVLIFLTAVRIAEKRMAVKIENAGVQMTSHTSEHRSAQVFMNNRWHAERNIDSLLVMGIDEYGSLQETDSYNNNHQTDFLALFLRDLDTGRTAAIHLNRDTMTDIMTLGVTGQETGMRYAQLALAYNYGSGDHVSSSNVVKAVERLLYGIKIDNYITVTMDAVPILNDWAGGVTVEVQDDFTGIDDALIQGELVKLQGEQALTYVRTRKDLEDSSNLHRMERQRQYASEWTKSAREKLNDKQAVADLVLQLGDYYRSSCTVEQLSSLAESLSNNPSMNVYEIRGAAKQGERFIEFYVHEKSLQQLVLELFYMPVD